MLLLGEIFGIAGLLSLYRVDASFILEDTFPDSLNHQFASLSQFNDHSCPLEQSVMMQDIMSGLLTATAPNIQREQGYRVPFIVNCSVLFYSEVEQIICDTGFSNVKTLLPYVGNEALPSTEVSFLHKGNILKTSMVVGLEPLQHPQVLYWLYFKLPPTGSESTEHSLSLSYTTTKHLTNTQEETTSQSISIESSDTASLLETESIDKTISESDALSSTNTESETNTPLYSLSTSPSQTGTSSRTWSKSSTQTPSSSLSVFLRTHSLSGTDTFSQSVSLSSSQTFSQSLTQSNTVQLQNATIWSSSAYADATNQTGRYVIANPGINATVQDTLTGLI